MAGSRDRAVPRALRARPVQALALLATSTAMVAAAATAPLYTRAMTQSLTTAEVTRAALVTSSLDVVAQPGAQIQGIDVPPPVPKDLARQVPAAIRSHYGSPLLGLSAPADNRSVKLDGHVVWRAGQCDHVTWKQGRCPQARNEIAVSEADLGLSRVVLGAVIEIQGIIISGRQTSVPLKVVGVYRPAAGAFWQARPPTGSSGLHTGTEDAVLHDDWLTTEDTFINQDAATVDPVVSEAVFPLDPSRTDVDDLLALPAQLHAAQLRANKYASSTTTLFRTGVGDLAADVVHQRRQADKTVPLLVAQVLLLGLLVSWQLLAAAAAQRRGEAALAVLRGRGRAGAARLLAGELLPPVLAGAPLGGLVALALGWWVRHHALPFSPPAEVVPGFWVAVGGCAVVLVALAVAAVVLVTREPVGQLLRSVQRPPGIGVWPAVAMAVAGTGAVAFVAGWLGTTGALAGPALLAVVVGLLLSYAVVPLAARAARSALRRGLVRTALALTDAARSPGARRLVVMTTVATALLVFAADAVAVGSRNRERAAQEQLGAAQVFTVDGDLHSVRAAVEDLDRHGSEATVVVTKAYPAGTDTVTTVGVDPDRFPRIALLGDDQQRLPWSRLVPSTTPPLELTGSSLELTADGQLTASSGVSVDLTLVDPDGRTRIVGLGAVRRDGRAVLRATVDCPQACTVTAIDVESRPGEDVEGTITLDDLLVDHRPVALGPANHWHDQTGSNGRLSASDAPQRRLALHVETDGAARVTLVSAWLPLALPALISGHASGKGKLDVAGLDGIDRTATDLRRTERVPGLPYPAAITDLDALSRGAQPADVTIQVWSTDPGPGFAARLRSALERRDAKVVTATALPDTRLALDRSVAAWSLGLAVVVGAAGLLIALLALVVVAVTGWQARAYDLASLRMTGIPPRRLRQAGVVGQVGVIALSVVAGAASGLLGARLALDDVPLLAQDPVGWSLDLTVSWPAVAIAGGSALLALGVVGWLAVRVVTERADLERLREMA